MVALGASRLASAQSAEDLTDLTLEDLMNANESYEDACREKLGLPVATGTDMEEETDQGEGMPEEEEVPAEDDGSPPE